MALRVANAVENRRSHVYVGAASLALFRHSRTQTVNMHTYMTTNARASRIYRQTDRLLSLALKIESSHSLERWVVERVKTSPERGTKRWGWLIEEGWRKGRGVESGFE